MRSRPCGACAFFQTPAAYLFASANVAKATTVDWVDWTSVQGSQVFGVIKPGPDQVGVTFAGVGHATGVLKFTGTFDHITFTPNPVASSIVKDVKNAEAVGVLKPTNIKGIFDLKLLNQVLKADKQAAVKSA